MTTHCVIYVRCSTARQNTAYQKYYCEKYAKEQGWVVRGIHEDFAKSGTTTDKRTALECALDQLEKGDVLLVHQYDRLSRSAVDMEDINMILELKGARLISYTSLTDSELHPDKPHYAVAYIRVDQCSSYRGVTREAQIDAIEKYAAEKKLTIHTTYTDTPVFGDRYHLQKCLDSFQFGDALIVFSLRRLCDTSSEFENILEQVRERKGRIISIAEEIHGDINTTFIASAMMHHYDVMQFYSSRDESNDHIMDRRVDILEEEYYRDGYICILIEKNRILCAQWCHSLDEVSHHVDEDTIVYAYKYSGEHRDTSSFIRELNNYPPYSTPVEDIRSMVANKTGNEPILLSHGK